MCSQLLTEPDTPKNTDRYFREINYLRVSVTDRCNLRCFYCVPVAGLTLVPHKEILSYEEIVTVIEAGVRAGIKKVRLTGGEPLVRRGICNLVSRLAQMPGIKELSLTTNGVLLEKMAKPLKQAGLARINVSLDSLDPATFCRITGRDHCLDVQKGIDAALTAGFDPIKVNVVAIAGTNEHEFEAFARLTIDRPLSVRFIEYMPIGNYVKWDPKNSISTDAIQSCLEKQVGRLIPLKDGAPTDGPAQRFAFSGAVGEVGFINAMSGHFCETCNRMRLTADGKLRPCLFSDHEIDVKGVLRGGGTAKDLDQRFSMAIEKKPKSREKSGANGAGCSRAMSAIGG